MKNTDTKVNGIHPATPENGAEKIKFSMTPTYPTGSLHFLERLKDRCAEVANLRSESILRIIVVGAGLGGCAAAVALSRRGHRVTIFEQAPEVGEVGAGIQVPSNSTKLLLRWGLGPLLDGRKVEPASMNFRRWENGTVIGKTVLVPNFQQSFDAPYYVVHRAHLHDSLMQQAVDLGTDLKLNSKVVAYDPEVGSVTLSDGSVHSGDLIVAADGVRSLARSLLANEDLARPLPTGFAAYRAVVDTEKMRSDPDIAHLVDNPSLNLWIGDARHVMTYTISGGKSFNMVLSHPETSDPSTWSKDSIISDMRKNFAAWDPCLVKVIQMIESTTKWPLMSGQTLQQWVHPSQKLVILGDAAHAMLPYMSQGAAMAVEDAAALAEVLSNIQIKSEISRALALWQSVRIKRTSQMSQASLLNGILWHFPDGPEQVARDKGMRPEVEGKQFTTSPNQWSDPATQQWAYGYDAESEIRAAWDEARLGKLG